jgi:pyruvate ferredoxin oxidoreductase gamma subunit
VRAGITKPDIVVVLDPSLLNIIDITAGLEESGLLVVNTRGSIEAIEARFGTSWKIAIVNATSIAREFLGRPIFNTTMIGALIRASGVVKPDSLIEPMN